jgi:tetratricopeptide (TPR) repeat protein
MSRLQFALILLVIAIGIYIPWGSVEFLLWDDGTHLIHNPLYHPLTWHSFQMIWAHPYAAMYLPLVYTVWGVFIGLLELLIGSHWQTLPTLFLILNLIVHLLNTWLVFLLLQQLVKPPLSAKISPLWPAGLGAVTFLFHPLQVECIAWASGFKDMIWVTFALLAIQIYLRRPRFYKLWVSGLFLLALAAKPTAVVLPALLWILVPTLFAIALLPVALAFAFFIRTVQPANLTDAPLHLGGRVLQAADSFGFYLKKLALPYNLIPDYGRSPAWFAHQSLTLEVGLFLVVTIVGLVVAWRWRSSRPSLKLVGAFVWLPLLPVSGLVPFAFQNYSTVADRYFYFSMIGCALIVAEFVHFKPIARWGLTGLCVVWILLSFQQTQIWRSNKLLFLTTLEVNPNSYMAENNLGVLREMAGDDREALIYFQNSYALNPRYLPAAQNLGIELVKTGQNAHALEHYLNVMNQDEGLFEIRLGLGTLLMHLNRDAEALEHLHRAVELNAASASAQTNLAIVFTKLGRLNEALPHFQMAVQLEPDNADFQNNLLHAQQQLHH